LFSQNYVPNWDEPGSEMWKFLEQVVELFTPFVTVIAMLEGDHVTLSVSIVAFCYLEKAIDKAELNCIS